MILQSAVISKKVYWTLCALNIPGIVLMAAWTFLGLFSIHDGWWGALINFLLIGLAMAMIGNAFRAHDQMWDDNLRMANLRLFPSIFLPWVLFAGVWYGATTQI